MPATGGANVRRVAILLLALPLAACAHNQLISDVLARARHYCANWGVYPNDPRYPGCLDRFAGYYELEVHRLDDGSLTLVTIPGGPAAGPGP